MAIVEVFGCSKDCGLAGDTNVEMFTRKTMAAGLWRRHGPGRENWMKTGSVILNPNQAAVD